MSEPAWDRKTAVVSALRLIRTSRTAKAEGELEWYFTEGLALFERSSVGAILDRLERESCAKLSCPKCCGEERRAVVAAMQRQIHLIDRDMLGAAIMTPGILANGNVCPKCGGTGSVFAPMGQGHTGKVTARPMGFEVKQAGYQVDESLMTRYAQVTRWLMRVGSECADVLCAYYGSDACRCAMVDPWGAHLAIMPQTAAGKKLIEKSKAKGDLGLPPIERVRIQAILQKSAPIDWRGELIERAYGQAVGLLKLAHEAFAAEMERAR